MATLSISERRARRSARKSGASIPPQSLPGEGGAIPSSPIPDSSIPAGQIPHFGVTDSPDPSVTADMAAGDVPVVRGNSNQQPMNAQGHATARKVGRELASIGGPDVIAPSAARRTVETAQDISSETGAPITKPDPRLESHAMGNLEGEPKTPEVKRYLAELMRNAPNFKLPGQGAMSNRPGESFNDFKVRTLSAVRGLLQTLAAKPTEKILVPTSTQVIRLIEAWAALGCPDNMDVSPDAFLKEQPGAPGDMFRFWPEQDGKWKLTPFKPVSKDKMPPGVYFMRHGETDSVQASKAEAGQKSRAQIIAHIRTGNYGKARDTAKHALANGHMSEDDISDAVDEALPNADSAQNMEPHQLLSATTAASPEKKAELMPVLAQKLGNLEGVEPHGQNLIRAHLGRIR